MEVSNMPMVIASATTIPTDIVSEVMSLVPDVGTALFNMYPLNVFIVLSIVGGLVALVGKGKRAARR